MDRMSADMMETETTVAAAAPQQQGQNDVGKELLTMARNLIDQGKPSQALQVVVMAVRTRGGDEAVFQSLHRAREVYRTRIQENTAVDQLASLFAECAIAEAQPSKAESLPCNLNGPSVASDAHGTSIHVTPCNHPEFPHASSIVEQNLRAAPRANLSTIAPLATCLELQTKI